MCLNADESAPVLEQSDKPNSTSNHIVESRVIIRQNELVEFAKKFALEKADYEDRLDAMRNDFSRQEVTNRRNYDELRRLAEKLQ